MCIIIDANVANEFSPLTDAARGIFEWITEGGRIASGGRLKTELLKTNFVFFISLYCWRGGS
jgi:hypothetical protein